MRHGTWLRLIAGLKLAEGILLLAVAIGMLVLELRQAWFDALVGWVAAELLLPHGNVLFSALRELDLLLAGNHLRALGLLALVYAALFLVEGIGVWLERRWGEWLMVIATAGLIPLEIAETLSRPSAAKLALIAANGAIVLYLIRVLRRRHA
ncbi:MAG: DUF2127 domain-containing protein [Alphaproteobacteria bacterium]|nr:DUF2127 domain-containing protein [Alphaproteobacteria bacterium]